MADEIARAQQYQYAANSNLVLQADRSELPRRDQEPTGEPETLHGRIDPGSFGARAARAAPPSAQDKGKGPASSAAKYGARRGEVLDGPGGPDDLDAEEEGEDLLYEPQSLESQESYGLLLAFIRTHIQDESHSLLQSMADQILVILHDRELRDLDRKREVELLLDLPKDSLPSDRFSQLLNISSRLTDYDAQVAESHDQRVKPQTSSHLEGAQIDESGGMDDELGVAVVFDEDEEEEDEEEEEEEEEDEEFDQEDKDQEEDQEDQEGSVQEEQVLIGSTDTSIPTKPSSSKKPLPEEDGSLDVHQIDAYWLQRKMGSYFPGDPLIAQEKADAALKLLADESGLGRGGCENALLQLLGYEADRFPFVRLLIQHRTLIVWATLLARAGPHGEERARLEAQATEAGASWVVEALSGPSPAHEHQLKDDSMDIDTAQDHLRRQGRDQRIKQEAKVDAILPKRLLDLPSLTFPRGGHTMTNRQCRLPEGSSKKSFQGYEEIHIPPPPRLPPSDQTLISLEDLPSWAQPGFPGIKSLNPVQSSIYPAAFQRDENLLVCAPTGAGKTNIAMLCILRELGKVHTLSTQDGSSKFNFDNIQIVYVAPMKALVAEVVGNLRGRLAQAPFHATVEEMTGDRHLSRWQLDRTTIVVTTPEKWDVVTRRPSDRAALQRVRLVIIDEVHLLHDSRGPVLESIVARTLRESEDRVQEMGGDASAIRLVGLSATLPNYQDVGAFLRVSPKTGLYHFDARYRPCPLRLLYVGVEGKSAVKRHQRLTEQTWARVSERAGAPTPRQVLVFVHSRKETGRTARALRDRAIEEGSPGLFIPGGGTGGSRAVLEEMAGEVSDRELRELVTHGIGIHHAGMARADRTLVEDLFSSGHLTTLVSTATLAWGVNLPASTVIIRGTRVYSPESGRWEELSPQDVLQMLGRAGRPQYDREGEGIILTGAGELPYYLSLLTAQLPIESQLISKLPDALNAEISRGTIGSRADGVAWLGYTYLYVRMLTSGPLYGLGAADQADGADTGLLQRRVDLVHAAASQLERARMIQYDRRSGRIRPTDLGRIGAQYYCSPGTMARFARMGLGGDIGWMELLRTFAGADEFLGLGIRPEEKMEVARLTERVPIPIREALAQGSVKVNILLQAYIGRLPLEGSALAADRSYVVQSAGRLLRAMFEVCWRGGWASRAHTALALAHAVEHRQWPVQSPLRQFLHLPSLTTAPTGGASALSADVVRRLERRDFPWERMGDLTPEELGELVGTGGSSGSGTLQMGRRIHRAVHWVPRLEVQVLVQPLTPSLLSVECSLVPDFAWDRRIHGSGPMGWWIWVGGPEEERLLHGELIEIPPPPANSSEEPVEKLVRFTLPLLEPRAPAYILHVEADRWIGTEVKVPISLQQLHVPPRFPALTELLDLQPLPVQALGSIKVNSSSVSLGQIYLDRGMTHFSPLVTQVFPVVFGTREDEGSSSKGIFIGGPYGAGVEVCGELSILRWWKEGRGGKAIWLSPFEECLDRQKRRWDSLFSETLGIRVERLTGEGAGDLRRLETSDLVVCTPRQLDSLTRRWRQRKVVQAIQLLIGTDLQCLGGEGSEGSGEGLEAEEASIYEAVLSRTRRMTMELGTEMVFVGLSLSLTDPRDLASWMGIPKQNTFNFPPTARSTPLAIYPQTFDVPEHASLMLTLIRPVVRAIDEHGSGKGDQRHRAAIVFVGMRREARRIAGELGALGGRRWSDPWFLYQQQRKMDEMEEDEDQQGPPPPHDVEEAWATGVTYLHDGLPARVRECIEGLVAHPSGRGGIHVVVSSREGGRSGALRAPLVIVMGGEVWRGGQRERQWSPLPSPELVRLVGCAQETTMEEEGGKGCVAVIMSSSAHKARLMRALTEPLPLESRLDRGFHDALLAEVVAGGIGSRQEAVDFLTWTLLYRRLMANPNYYGLPSATHEHLSDHLSELVENTLGDLEAAHCLSLRAEDEEENEEEEEEEEELSPLNLGMIASYYGLGYGTVEALSLGITARTRLRGLLETVASIPDWESLAPLRPGEDRILSRLAPTLPLRLPGAGGNTGFDKVHVKVHLLLQAHLSRRELPPDLSADLQLLLLPRIPALLCAAVDVAASAGWLKPALAAMDFSQLLIQAQWEHESPLRQLPVLGSDKAWVARATEELKVESVFDFADAMADEEESEVKEALLRDVSPKVVREVAHFVNTYPSIEVAYTLPKTRDVGPRVGEACMVNVTLTREEDEEEDGMRGHQVTAPFFPSKKEEGWWVVVGETGPDGALLGIKRLTMSKATTAVRVPVTPRHAGTQSKWILYLMSDSYIGCDQEYEIEVDVEEEEDDEEEEEEEDDRMEE
ncbi:Sec63 Brl domain-containing protein [Piptocephalis cylindrospora]|uniref:U5 small nuclear ribonucleoprotein 200 kDa helicase n=1 Tax=Piptocephalis cylindrospora TaxID=1907219 RepID=A0A4V1IYM4_9FUNG|nr:Sec63 Brl domain-containing protein [Piptocephalis cylindrospora]|eukprot:RKP15069.1 Sec63 Brl domain-containing protein [Piptocephalis cylindrospora]